MPLPHPTEFEAARHDGPEKSFSSLAAALDHIKGSDSDTTRPYVRVAGPQISGSFLIIAGKALTVEPGRAPDATRGLESLSPNDRNLLSQWKHVDPGVQKLLAEIDLCNNGYARLDCLKPELRQVLARAVAQGHVVVGHNVVHRPGLDMRQAVVQTPEEARRGTPLMQDDADWEEAILARQERHMMDM